MNAAENLDQPSFNLTSNLSFLDLIYNGLIRPLALFAAIREEAEAKPPIFAALLIVVVVSAVAPVIAQIATSGASAEALLLEVPLAVVSGCLTWALMGLLIVLLAYAFVGEFRLRLFLTLSGLATLPWILMGPVSLLKTGLGPLGFILFVLGTLSIWLWSVLLFGLALMTTYRMPLERALIVLAAPIAASMIFMAWTFGFFSNIRLLFPRG